LRLRRQHPPALGAEEHPLQIGLRDDQAIERIVVMRRQAAGMLGMGARHRQDLEAERQYRRNDRSIEAKLADRPLDSDFPYCRRADDNLVGLVLNCGPQRTREPAELLIPPQKDVRIDQNSHPRLLKIFLDFGWQRSVEILRNVGDSKQILSATALLSGAVWHKLRLRLARLGDDDFFAGGGAIHQLGKVGLRIVEIDGFGHYCFPGASL
jgi:hypothetical protein